MFSTAHKSTFLLSLLLFVEYIMLEELIGNPALYENKGTQGVQELFFCALNVSEIGALMELFTVMMWLI